jgi:hypothetical protein
MDVQKQRWKDEMAQVVDRFAQRAAGAASMAVSNATSLDPASARAAAKSTTMLITAAQI